MNRLVLFTSQTIFLFLMVSSAAAIVHQNAETNETIIEITKTDNPTLPVSSAASKAKEPQKNQVENHVKETRTQKAMSPESDFLFTDNGFKMSSKVFNFIKLNKGTQQTRVIKIKNISGKTKEIYFAPLLDYVTYEATPRKLKNGEEGEISVTFDSNKCPLWDKFSGDFYLITEENSTHRNSPILQFVAEIVEDLSQLTAEQKANAPKICIDTTQIELGVVEKNSIQNIHLTFVNNGKDPLKVRKIINKNREINIVSYNRNVESAQTGILDLQLSTYALLPTLHKRKLYIQTNDPDNQLVVLEIDLEVKE